MANKISRMEVLGEAGSLLEFLQSRSTTRSYLTKEIDTDRLERILEAARFAPSAHNCQPWRFAVLSDVAKKLTLARAMGERLRSDRLADGEDPALIDEDVARSGKRIVSAPIVIVCCITLEDMDIYPDERRNQAEHWMAVQSASMATHDMMLAAHAEGLGACWMCAPLFCPDSIIETLGLSEQWIPQAVLTLGWADKPPRKRERLPLAKIVRFL